MDGNNRWSKKNNLNKYNGYKKGAKKLINLQILFLIIMNINIFQHLHYQKIILKDQKI